MTLERGPLCDPHSLCDVTHLLARVCPPFSKELWPFPFSSLSLLTCSLAETPELHRVRLMRQQGSCLWGLLGCVSCYHAAGRVRQWRAESKAPGSVCLSSSAAWQLLPVIPFFTWSLSRWRCGTVGKYSKRDYSGLKQPLKSLEHQRPLHFIHTDLVTRVWFQICCPFWSVNSEVFIAPVLVYEKKITHPPIWATAWKCTRWFYSARVHSVLKNVLLLHF